MREIRIKSISAPFDRPESQRSILRAVKRANAMGLLDRPLYQINLETMQAMLSSLHQAGIAQDLAVNDDITDYTVSASADLFSQLDEVLENSPAPDTEWLELTSLFDTDTLAALLSISPAALRRYKNGERKTPDAVAARLHFVTMVVSDLAGAYNDYGMRRWFVRERPQLDNQSPAKMLNGDWDPADDNPQRVRQLAQALTGGGAS